MKFTVSNTTSSSNASFCLANDKALSGWLLAAIMGSVFRNHGWCWRRWRDILFVIWAAVCNVSIWMLAWTLTLLWSQYVFRCYQIHGKTVDNKVPPVFVLHHGAGHSGLSYGLTAKRIKAITNSECSVLAYDCRGHGELLSSPSFWQHWNTAYSNDCDNSCHNIYNSCDNY